MQKICLIAVNAKIFFYRYKFPSNPSPEMIKMKAGSLGLLKGWPPDFLEGLKLFTRKGGGGGITNRAVSEKSTQA